jgi:hypothetical protein
MSADRAAPVADQGRDPDAEVMGRHGIHRVASNHYHVDGYRYTSLADAVAQAQRSEARLTAGPRPRSL